MTNIQILFLSTLIITNIAIYFVIFVTEYKRNKKVHDLEIENKKIKDYCNTLFDKLKEIVNKINPLLETQSSGDIQEAMVKNDKHD